MQLRLSLLTLFCFLAFFQTSASLGQRVQFPEAAPSAGLRPVQGNGAIPSTSLPQMVPFNAQGGIYPSAGGINPNFDPYGSSALNTPSLLTPNFGSAVVPAQSYAGVPPGSMAPGLPGINNFPAYSGAQPVLPGTGPSAIVQTFPNTAPQYSQPGVYPNSAPSALFPGAYGSLGGSSGNTGGIFGGLFGGSSGFGGSYGQPAYPGQPYGAPTTTLPPGYGPSYAGGYNWNPQGTIFNGQLGQMPEFIRLFQGPRFRHAWVNGNNQHNALMINDSDVALAFAIPNFLYSTQPLYLLPSFSLHQWDGPHPDANPATNADLPALAYSAFLDTGWQSDPARILGAELGLRVGMFTDFNTANSDSLRIMGRGIGRIRLTPRATLKLGVMYLDRNKVKLLPAGGILWQPNPDTRFDIFFPEPKLSHYLSTLGTVDTWWYVGGYYGGGAWTVTRANSKEESIDINDLRLVLGVEWGRNEQMREGRRMGFLEVGYVFDRELLYNLTPADNLSLQDTVMVRAGIGY